MEDYERLEMLEYPKGRIDIVIDTDAATEVDDPFAIAYVMLSPERFAVRGIYAAPFAMNERASDPRTGMEMSYEEIRRILSMCRTECEIYKGCSRFGLNQKAPACEHLVQLAENYDREHPLYVLALGASTNIANAITQHPEICGKIVVVWLAGNDFEDSPDVYNIYQDAEAARAVFDSGVPLVHVPCSPVTSHLITSIPELEHCIGGKNRLCEYLLRIVKEYASEPFGWGKQIWDVGAAAYLVKEEYTECEITTAPVITAELRWGRDYRRHLIKNVKAVKRDAIFRDLFYRLGTVREDI